MEQINRVKPFVIGITGGSASGKTLFLKSLLDHFSPDEICLISQDNYYKSIELVPKDNNGVENFDLPESIDFELYAEHIRALMNGRSIIHKEYVFNNAQKESISLEFKSTPVIVVEGLFVFYEQSISDLLDLKVFIDAKEHIKIKRRIIRDNNERGYDLTDVLYRWENHVAPTYEKFILPTKHVADIVINNNDHFKNGLWVLTTFIKSLIEK